MNIPEELFPYTVYVAFHTDEQEFVLDGSFNKEQIEWLLNHWGYN